MLNSYPEHPGRDGSFKSFLKGLVLTFYLKYKCGYFPLRRLPLVCLKQREERRREREIDEGKGALDGSSCCSCFLGWKRQQLWQLSVEEASLSLLTSYQPLSSGILPASQIGLVVWLGSWGYLRIISVSESSVDLAPCSSSPAFLFIGPSARSCQPRPYYPSDARSAFMPAQDQQAQISRGFL